MTVGDMLLMMSEYARTFLALCAPSRSLAFTMTKGETRPMIFISQPVRHQVPVAAAASIAASEAATIES
jgi:hypothetical protein